MWLDPELSLRQGFSSVQCLFNHILWNSFHRGEQCWSLRGQCRHSRGLRCISQRAPSCLHCAISVGTSSCCPHLLYIQPYVWVFFILTAGHALQSPLSPPCCGVLPHCRRGPQGLLVFMRGQIVVDRPQAVFQIASEALPKSVPMITTPIPPRCRSRSKLPLYPAAGLFLLCWHPRYSVELLH